MKTAEFEVIVDEMLEEIYPKYLGILNETLVKINNAKENKDASIIKSYAHQIAGNAGSYGLDELGLIGRRLEELASKDHADFNHLCEIIKELENYLEYLKVKFA